MRRSFCRLITAALSLLVVTSLHAQADPGIDSLFTRREVMIPMRDGVRLFTVILTPMNASGPLPIILSRTPYGTADWGGTSGIGYGFSDLIRDGYIFVFQDIRGRNKSEGEFIMNRPPRSARDSNGVDESTDTWDAIDWLVKNVTPNNGRVGMLGISYPGWLSNMAAIHPHPALKAVSPQATMADTWMGDDFFHQGAFRLSYGLEYSWMMEASNDGSVTPAPGRFDTYDWYRSFPTLDSLGKAVGAMRWPTWKRFTEHPAYDSVWQARALTSFLTSTPIPMLSVGGWWDQEDLYGPQATYAAIEPHDQAHRNFLVLGPWYHGEWFIEAGDSLGNARFGSATGEYFRREIQARWFAYWLKDQGDGKFSEVTAFDAGARRWKTFDAWPPATAKIGHLYFHSGGRLSFEPPTEALSSDSFISDPAHPVPYRPRPVEWTYDTRGSRWERWMTEDQRIVDGRSDVLTWQTAPLDHDVAIAGEVVAKLFASTTGTDADWVVKLIDVYPDSLQERPAMGGYELMIAGDIMRGRYRTSFSRPRAIVPNIAQSYQVDLHGQAYTFQRGHRIMVQVQSTWFPLYDRNPQTYVPNIFLAPASAYRARTHRILHDRTHPSSVDVMVLPPTADSITAVEQTSGTNALLIAISPVNENVVWASGTNGTWVRTIDGGATWQTGRVPGADTLQFRDVHAVDANTAWLLSIGNGDQSRIYHTSDAGKTWTLQFTNQDPKAFFDCFDFWDSSHGIAVSDAVDGHTAMIATTDGGAHWTPLPAGSLPAALEGEGSFAASGTCMIVWSGGHAWNAAGTPMARLLHSGNYGQSWTVDTIPLVAISSFAIRDLQHWIVLGTDSSAATASTGDGGKTWVRGGAPPFKMGFYGGVFVPDARTPAVVAVGPGGLAWSRDAGATWTVMNDHVYWSVGFASSRAGWAVGARGRITRLSGF